MLGLQQPALRPRCFRDKVWPEKGESLTWPGPTLRSANWANADWGFPLGCVVIAFLAALPALHTLCFPNLCLRAQGTHTRNQNEEAPATLRCQIDDAPVALGGPVACAVSGFRLPVRTLPGVTPPGESARREKRRRGKAVTQDRLERRRFAGSAPTSAAGGLFDGFRVVSRVCLILGEVWGDVPIYKKVI